MISYFYAMKNLSALKFVWLLVFGVLLNACGAQYDTLMPKDSIKEITKHITDVRQRVCVHVPHEFNLIGSISLIINTWPEHGQLVFDNNLLVFIPHANFKPGMSDEISFYAKASNANQIPTLCSIQITWPTSALSPECHAGVQSDVFEVMLNTASTLTPLFNDPYCYKSTARALSIPVPPSFGLIDVMADGTLTYTPNDGFIGTDRFVYAHVNIDGLMSYANVAVVVRDGSSCSLPLSAKNDDYTFETLQKNAEGALELNVLSNDLFCTSEMDWSEFKITKNPQYGQVKIDPQTQKIVYVPSAQFESYDLFEYTITNNKAQKSTTKVFIRRQAPCTTKAVNDVCTLKADSGMPSYGVEVLYNDSLCANNDKDYGLRIVKSPHSGKAEVYGRSDSFRTTLLFYTPTNYSNAIDSLVYGITLKSMQDSVISRGTVYFIR
ncbi:MAG: hypothetical protein EAZ57_08660 [Cytophagales bacterium]|nr:MAG: hypothetical protein EAZ67_09470 [Cytophagales bacterium]TAF60097.1 MAG: hypothetical protein EAZ57_08660 [Cytophagales bacterium]